METTVLLGSVPGNAARRRAERLERMLRRGPVRSSDAGSLRARPRAGSGPGRAPASSSDSIGDDRRPVGRRSASEPAGGGGSGGVAPLRSRSIRWASRECGARDTSGPATLRRSGASRRCRAGCRRTRPGGSGPFRPRPPPGRSAPARRARRRSDRCGAHRPRGACRSDGRAEGPARYRSEPAPAGRRSGSGARPDSPARASRAGTGVRTAARSRIAPSAPDRPRRRASR